MNFERIDHLVTENDFCLQSWNDRYDKGVWVALGTSEDEIDVVRDLSSAGDQDMIPAMEYVSSAEWLPYATGRTAAEAMQRLEERLASLPQDQLTFQSPWRCLVRDAIETLARATRGRSWYGDKVPDKLENLPATFQLAAKDSVFID